MDFYSGLWAVMATSLYGYWWGWGGLYSLCRPTNCSLNGAKLSSLFSLNHCKERMFKLLLSEIAFLPSLYHFLWPTRLTVGTEMLDSESPNCEMGEL